MRYSQVSPKLYLLVAIMLLGFFGCSEPCQIPIESTPSTGGAPRLKEGSSITYEATIGDSNVKVFQRPPWIERVLTFGATIGGRDSVLATESLEDLLLRFQDSDDRTFYQYMPLMLGQDVMQASFWLKLPLNSDTLTQHVIDTSEWRHQIDITYKSYWVRDDVDTIDGKPYPIKHIQTDLSWDDREIDDQLVHEERKLWTDVIPSLGIFSEQTAFGASGRPRSHIIVKKIAF